MINFPNSPSQGQVFTSTTGLQYVYLDGVWRIVEAPQDIGKAQTRNRIVNGAMQISQENGSATGTTNNYYMADQFAASFISTGTFACTWVSPGVGGAAFTPNGSLHRLRIGISTADTSLTTNERLQFRTSIEGLNITDFRWGYSAARQAILRFGWRSPAGTYAVAITNGDNTRSYVALFTVSAGQANADTEQTLVIPGDTAGVWAVDNGIGMQIGWTIGTGPTMTGVVGWQTSASPGIAGAPGVSNGMGAAAAVFELFDAGLYLDPLNTGIAPPWQMPDEAEELRACQRYWQPTNLSAQSPVAGSILTPFYFRVQMRVTPAAANISTGSAASATVATEAAFNSLGGYFQISSTGTPGYVINRYTAYSARM